MDVSAVYELMTTAVVSRCMHRSMLTLRSKSSRPETIPGRRAKGVRPTALPRDGLYRNYDSRLDPFLLRLRTDTWSAYKVSWAERISLLH